MKTERNEETPPFLWTQSWVFCLHKICTSLAGGGNVRPGPSAEDPSQAPGCELALARAMLSRTQHHPLLLGYMAQPGGPGR